METIGRPLSRSSVVVVFFVVLALSFFLCTRYLDSSAALMGTNSSHESVSTDKTIPSEVSWNHQKAPETIDIALNCSLASMPSPACPANYYPATIPGEYETLSSMPSPSCPDYFRWIHDDLWPWRETGVTREMVMGAQRTANFRLVVLNGKVYVETYGKSFQTRDTFTLWGILQLLRRYPGRVPDLDLMFDCDDWPVIKKGDFGHPDGQAPPLMMFRYCSNDGWYDVVFPDWSFWGWPEINIKPWNELSKDMQEGKEGTKWTDREPHAFWKGNPAVAATRQDLLKCNVSDKQDWNARVYVQDWIKEQNTGYKNSDLASQCIHRYKIYIEGSAWSVSEKYILACNSLTLLVKPNFYDFFTRGLTPLKHYWPIKDDDKCRSIKHAVDWGNKHQEEAQAMGKAASRFILEDVRMDFVYDYMFHLLTEYAKLLRYKPTIPEKAVELCSESMACVAQGLEKKFMMDSLVKGPSVSNPCTMPPPYDPATLHSFILRKERGMEQVATWEKEYWQSNSSQV